MERADLGGDGKSDEEQTPSNCGRGGVETRADGGCIPGSHGTDPARTAEGGRMPSGRRRPACGRGCDYGARKCRDYEKYKAFSEALSRTIRDPLSNGRRVSDSPIPS